MSHNTDSKLNVRLAIHVTLTLVVIVIDIVNRAWSKWGGSKIAFFQIVVILAEPRRMWSCTLHYCTFALL